jgi:hypothetical protein
VYVDSSVRVSSGSTIDRAAIASFLYAICRFLRCPACDVFKPREPVANDRNEFANAINKTLPDSSEMAKKPYARDPEKVIARDGTAPLWVP